VHARQEEVVARLLAQSRKLVLHNNSRAASSARFDPAIRHILAGPRIAGVVTG